MSFILDALKKSESDRQRQSGPALFEVRVAPPRTRLPPWAIAVALLLLLNLGVVMWMLLRHQAHGGSPGATPTAAGAHTAGAAAGAAAQDAPASTPALAARAPAVPVVATGAAAGSVASPEASTGASSPPPAPVPSAAPTAAPGAVAPNAEDYAPAEEPSAPTLGSHVRRGTASGVPLYQDLSTTPGAQLPQLRLDLHVFAAHPEDRFVMINMHRLREGDTLPEGVRVDSITPEGAVLSFNGSKFLLPRD
jgi:general secretion pathway protein B